MLRRLISHRICTPITIECRRISYDPSAIVSMMGNMFKMGKTPEVSEELHAIQTGASRVWDLGNPKSKYVCIGGMGPINLGDNVKVSQLIDFKNTEFNKLHIELLDCPTLLATKLISTFPNLKLRKENLRIIKLSYHKYNDQNKGQLDCLIVANHLCKKLNEEGDFGFYSGAAIKNATNGIFFYNNKFFKTNNNEIHATVNSKKGYLHIDNLAADDVGIVYTDGDFDLKQLRIWIESIEPRVEEYIDD
ncbi:uncharacterized protein LOC129575366 [Sitodiplosis mosellana]|uniref:uncharacterized protein LOC129575366 n=1 Tax=Sitodiplosis mosellana TaxID=263140 RepID=UPI00244378C1|nr:uncharacterized protein LOC129575366 [Sitodiplosis mosellana]